MRVPRTLYLFPLTVFAFLLTTLAHADFQDGWDAYTRKDYSTALKEWQPLAEQGDAQAQYYLGVLYFKGEGVPQDYGQAREWWLKAAAQGHAIAQFNLGRLYEKGEGVPQDYAKAWEWYLKAAAPGDGLLSGDGIPYGQKTHSAFRYLKNSSSSIGVGLLSKSLTPHGVGLWCFRGQSELQFEGMRHIQNRARVMR
jgi:hypothetical protein